MALVDQAFMLPSMRILVVEDEPKAAAYLEQGLTESGFTVTIASNGEDGLEHARTGAFDLVVLDVGLPKRDGWSVLTELRREHTRTPILFLTARDAVQDRVHGLELGAEDYLIKPYAFSELLARIRTILRRGQTADVLRLADIEVDLVRQRATRGGRRLELTSSELALLSFFLRHAGDVLSRRLLAEQVWDLHFDSDTNVVDVGVRRLRAKIDDPFQLKLIHTVRGIGYVCAAKS